MSKLKVISSNILGSDIDDLDFITDIESDSIILNGYLHLTKDLEISNEFKPFNITKDLNVYPTKKSFYFLDFNVKYFVLSFQNGKLLKVKTIR